MTTFDLRMTSWCDGKREYGTWSLAAVALRGIVRRGELRQRTKSRLELYRCPSCRKWHLGNSAVLRRRFVEEPRLRWRVGRPWDPAWLTEVTL